MPWNASWPGGNVSVKANKATGQQNTTYIESTMGNAANATKDHYWNVSADSDGYHRTVNMPAQSAHKTPATVAMGGVMYLKVPSADVGRIEGFYANSSGRYQFIPSFKEGTVNLTSSFATVTSVPANVYGEIVMWRSSVGKNSAQSGFFRSDGSAVNAFGYYLGVEGSAETLNVKFGNGADASGFNIRAKTESASSGHDWSYKITYRAITN